VADADWAERIALFRYGVIAPATNWRLSMADRGQLVRHLAGQAWPHPDGDERVYARGTLDRWVRAYRAGGLEALKPKKRADNGAVRRHPELLSEGAALRVELPTRSAGMIAEILWERHKIRVSERTVRSYLARRGLTRQALTAEPARAYGRYEAEHANERWICDVLVGPWIPHPRVEESRRGRLFVIIDDHSRLVVHGEWHRVEDTRAAQQTLRRAIERRGLPEQLYVDNGAPFASRQLARTCGVLGIQLIHSRPYQPQGRGKQERINRMIRERFLAEAQHQGIPDFEWLNERWMAWAERWANGRIHAEHRFPPLARWHDGHPTPNGRPRAADQDRLADAFRWSELRTVTKTATVSLDGNHYRVDPALVGRKIELRYDPADLTRIDVYLEGEPAGTAHPEVIRRHVHPAVTHHHDPPAATVETGIDYLGMVQDAWDADTIGRGITYRPPADTASDTAGGDLR
jgi:putative transposase